MMLVVLAVKSAHAVKPRVVLMTFDVMTQSKEKRHWLEFG
jgi:hypothetical protein